MSVPVIIRTIQCTVQNIEPTPPLVVYERKRGHGSYQPKRLYMNARLDERSGQWQGYVHVSGPMIRKDRTHSYLEHSEVYGHMHAPLPPWMRKRLLANDIPDEIKEAVLLLPFYVEVTSADG